MTGLRQKVSIPIKGISSRPLIPTKNSPSRYVSALRNICQTVCGWVQVQKAARSNTKRLHVAESVSLGDKRFVAVVHVDGLQFLIGGSATSVSLLAQLSPRREFNSSLERAIHSTSTTTKRKKPRVANSVIEQVGANS
jgi:hypothetical protein